MSHGTRLSPYTMPAQLAYEDTRKDDVEFVFLPHRIKDISALKSERKTGTDFLIRPADESLEDAQPIRAENKFETHLTGNAALEIISVDRKNFTPGWLFTTHAAWLCYWYPSGEMLAMFTEDVRDFVLAETGRFGATTARNRTYLSWNVLERLSHLIKRIPSARVLDVNKELGREYKGPRLFEGNPAVRWTTPDALIAHMKTYPRRVCPREISHSDLQAMARKLAKLDRKREANADMLNELPWLKAA